MSTLSALSYVAGMQRWITSHFLPKYAPPPALSLFCKHYHHSQWPWERPLGHLISLSSPRPIDFPKPLLPLPPLLILSPLDHHSCFLIGLRFSCHTTATSMTLLKHKSGRAVLLKADGQWRSVAYRVILSSWAWSGRTPHQYSFPVRPFILLPFSLFARNNMLCCCFQNAKAHSNFLTIPHAVFSARDAPKFSPALLLRVLLANSSSPSAPDSQLSAAEASATPSLEICF